MRISEGIHITAADPDEGRGGFVGLAPFTVHIIGGSGVSVYADYPPGEAYGGRTGAKDSGAFRVYRAEFDLPIVLERSGEWTGTPLIAVTFQPCTDTECLAPRTVELDVVIEAE